MVYLWTYRKKEKKKDVIVLCEYKIGLSMCACMCEDTYYDIMFGQVLRKFKNLLLLFILIKWLAVNVEKFEID